jgi:hypothetical protein
VNYERRRRNIAEKNELLIETTERGVVFRRIINAPRALVFKAWTDPAHVAKKVRVAS